MRCSEEQSDCDLDRREKRKQEEAHIASDLHAGERTSHTGAREKGK